MRLVAGFWLFIQQPVKQRWRELFFLSIAQP
ncbi:hypothetical protein CSE899_03906 [Cronobacter sakazakii E899]|nr:hypothetical protein CSE899_03906 [Cronobacter sakazakii E899]